MVIRWGVAKNFYFLRFLLPYTSLHVQVWLPVSSNIIFVDNRQLLRTSSGFVFDHAPLQ